MSEAARPQRSVSSEETLQRRIGADAHYRAVLSVEARRMARELTAYGPQTTAMLARRCHARHWSQGTLEAAVLVGLREGRLRRLPLGFLAAAERRGDPAQPPAARR